VAGEPADLEGVAAEILAKAGGAPLVVATCDAGLYPWQGRLRDVLLARRPGAVQVATGLPDGGAVCSYGRGRVNLRALAEVVVGAW